MAACVAYPAPKTKRQHTAALTPPHRPSWRAAPRRCAHGGIWGPRSWPGPSQPTQGRAAGAWRRPAPFLCGACCPSPCQPEPLLVSAPPGQPGALVGQWQLAQGGHSWHRGRTPALLDPQAAAGTISSDTSYHQQVRYTLRRSDGPDPSSSRASSNCSSPPAPVKQSKHLQQVRHMSRRNGESDPSSSKL